MHMDAKLLTAALLTGACAVTLTSHDVRACINGVEHRRDVQIKEIMTAERQVDHGHPQLAARTVLRYFPRIKKQRLRGNGLGARAARIMARSVVRTRGALHGGVLFPAETEEQRAANFEWSLHVLRSFSVETPKDARATTDLAEAFALVAKHEGDAKRMLTDLEKRDLVATPHGYATLADLRERAGADKPAFVMHPMRTLEHARAIVARARCNAMGGGEACRASPSPPNPSPPTASKPAKTGTQPTG